MVTCGQARGVAEKHCCGPLPIVPFPSCSSCFRGSKCLVSRACAARRALPASSSSRARARNRTPNRFSDFKDFDYDYEHEHRFAEHDFPTGGQSRSERCRLIVGNGILGITWATSLLAGASPQIKRDSRHRNCLTAHSPVQASLKWPASPQPVRHASPALPGGVTPCRCAW